MTEGPRVNFVMREALFEIYNGSSVLHTSMRNKQVEFIPYILIKISKLPLYEIEYFQEMFTKVPDILHSVIRIAYKCFTC